ncbi:MAG: c-type cytochrome, partial [Verrucomicrobiaceae bacterium]
GKTTLIEHFTAGFDDILFSNDSRFAIYLWAKNVRPELGWTRGWSHPVREGPRTGAAVEPLSVAGAEVTLDGGVLTITRPARDGQPAAVAKVTAKQLIAFDIPPPKSPVEALESFRVRPGFRVELVAAEPEVIDPVAFDWDAQGRLWVVEMRDYPMGMDGKGKAGGMVKLLEDADGDGRYERATPFLEDIPYPTSVMPWGKGVLLTAAPDLFYAEDTDGDGRADVRKVLFTGFHPGNQQHRFNGFDRGLDGWIYAANGDSGGEVKSLATGRELSISGRDVRFRPDTGEIETVSSQSQYGLRRDDWGNWFGNNNSTWLWHVTLPEHYLRRNPRLPVKSVHHVLANYETPTRVFPASAAMVRPNQPWSLNHVTSACSPVPYRDELFGSAFSTSVFICEPVHNAVHREVLEREGSGFTSHRAKGEESGEFLASTDNWFRPVFLKTGPDGALYVADIYRFVLEHPEWIAPEMQQRLDVRAGEDKGRLYRIVPEGWSRRPVPKLAGRTVAELAAALDSPNGWRRDTAMTLLTERRDPAAAAPLRALLDLAHAPKVRLQALATLGQLKQLDREILTAALADPHPEVRCEALRQSEAFAGTEPALFTAVAALADDSQAEVRLQAAFSLGAWPPALNEPVLHRLALREDADESLRAALQSSLRPESELFAQLQAESSLPRPAPTAAVALTASSPDREAVIAGYAGVGKMTGDAVRGQAHFQQLCATCHRLRGEGQSVGPDLGMTSSKPVDWLLTAILDPNQNVEARYRPWLLTLKSGDSLSGLVSAETANNLVLRLPGGAEHAVLRADIQKQEPLSISLMPLGFESVLKPQDMADLLRWLRGP